MKTFKVIMHKIIEQEHYIEAKSFDEALERAKTPESSVVSRDLAVKEHRIIEIKEIDRKDIGT